MPQCFAPIADENALVLILGTMPSVQSLQKQQYYGHPQNSFWRIIFSLWEKETPNDYEFRKNFLLSKGIALWDVLMNCERQGSADSDIQQPISNDFLGFSKCYPNIKAIFFNSRNAEIFYQRLVKPDPFQALPKTTLPSTSPARAMAFKKKRDLWLPIRETLDEIN